LEAQQLARAAGRQAVAAMNFSDASDEEDELIASIIDSSNAAVAEAIRWEDKNEPTKGSANRRTCLATTLRDISGFLLITSASILFIPNAYSGAVIG